MLPPDRLLVARSDAERVVSPFQYYTQPGEAIYCLVFAGHHLNARLYLHYDAAGQLLARVLDNDASDDELLAPWLEVNRAQLDALEPAPAAFDDLMQAMHLSSANGQGARWQSDELAELRAISSKPPVVIGGCGRSGTTLLLSILGAHPNIFPLLEEMYAFYPWPFRLQPLLAALQDMAPGQRWCEKTPKNVRAFAPILQAFDGQVRLIHMVRDGRAVVTSHHPNAVERYYVPPERWVADVSAGLRCSDQTLLLRYEDLVQEPEQTLRMVCDFIGEEFDTRLLAFEQHSPLQENKAWQGKKIRPLHNQRLDHWQAEQHQARVETFLALPEARNLMQRLGYLG